MASLYAIERMLELVKSNADEPNVGAKYSDDELLQRIEAAVRSVMSEINAVADNLMRVRQNISVVQYSTVFLLPPNMEQVLRVAKIDSTTGVPEWTIEPKSELDFFGPGFRLEGRAFRFDPPWQADAHTLQILYIPSGDVRLHYGTTTTFTTTSLTMATTPTKGTLDTRENAYAGGILRAWTSGGVLQERAITAHDRTTRVLTVEPAFSPALTGTAYYEVIPSYLPQLETVVTWAVAASLRAISGDQKKYGLAQLEQTKAMRTLRAAIKRQNMLGTAYESGGRHE